jgi:hypothetical protein
LWVGDESYFDGVKHLMPNNFLNLNSMSVERYWPDRKLGRIDFEVAKDEVCNYLKGAMKAVTVRFETMVAVTAGFDSRSLLAASKDILNEVYFFVNQEPRLNKKSRDLIIPSRIFKRIKQKFTVHKVSSQVDEKFREIYLESVFLANDLILPANFNVYFKNFQQKVNLDGTGEIGREYYGEVPKEVDGYFLSRYMKYRNSRYAIEQCDKWLNEVWDSAQSNNVDILKLLFWEVVIGNWCALAHSEADICIDQFDIYDSHHILEIMLSVGFIGDDLFKGIIRQMWPELLEFPFNPPESLKGWMRYLLQKTGIFKYLRGLLYRYERRRFYKNLRKAY